MFYLDNVRESIEMFLKLTIMFGTAADIRSTNTNQ